MNNFRRFAAVLAFLAAGAAHAAHPGSVDLKALDRYSDDAPTFAVSLGDWALSFGEEALAEDPELAALKGLESVSVRIYESASDGIRLAADELASDLGSQGWMPVATVNDGGDRVRVLMKAGGQDIAGITVLVTSRGGEAVFVNAYGEIRSEDLGRMLSGLGELDGLEDLKVANGQ